MPFSLDSLEKLAKQWYTEYQRARKIANTRPEFRTIAYHCFKMYRTNQHTIKVLEESISR